jgi:hypothetical protein
MKARILTELDYRDLGDGVRVELLSPVSVQAGADIIRVPAGFVSDLASVPWLFRRSFPRFGPWNGGAIVHDYLYMAGAVNGHDITREYADKVFLALMLSNPACSRFKAHAMYIAVRVGAFSVWYGYRRG